MTNIGNYLKNRLVVFTMHLRLPLNIIYIVVDNDRGCITRRVERNYTAITVPDRCLVIRFGVNFRIDSFRGAPVVRQK